MTKERNKKLLKRMHNISCQLRSLPSLVVLILKKISFNCGSPGIRVSFPKLLEIYLLDAFYHKQKESTELIKATLRFLPLKT